MSTKKIFERERGELEQRLAKTNSSQRASWEDLTIKEFQRYYETNFAGMSRSEVHIHSQGRKFYQAVMRRGMLDDVFPKRKYNDYQGWTLSDFQDYYQDNFSGMTRQELKHDPEGASFYYAVHDRGYTNRVIPESQKSYRGWSVAKFRKYYRQHFRGMGRVEVYRHAQGNRFYNALFHRNLIDDILPASKIKDYRKWTLDDFKRYYGEHFSGFTRKEVELAPGGRKFYLAVISRGFGDGIFPPKKDSKPRGYYNSLDNVQKELEDIIVELDGRFPQPVEIMKRNKGLYGAINERYGGLANIKIRLGYAQQELGVIEALVKVA